MHGRSVEPSLAEIHQETSELLDTLYKRIQKTGENDLHELLVNDCGYNEGTICVVNG